MEKIDYIYDSIQKLREALAPEPTARQVRCHVIADGEHIYTFDYHPDDAFYCPGDMIYLRLDLLQRPVEYRVEKAEFIARDGKSWDTIEITVKQEDR